MRVNIRGMIASRKAKMQEKRQLKYMTKLEKADKLRAERMEREKEKVISDYYKEEKAKIRQLKTERARTLAKKVGSGLKKAREGLKKSQKSRLKSSMGSTTGSRNVFGSGSSGINFGGQNVFSGPQKTAPKKPSGKRIIINL